jgi:hypothetical protein
MLGGTSRAALAGLLTIFSVSVGLIVADGAGLFAGDNREDRLGTPGSPPTISAECRADGTWQAYAAIVVEVGTAQGSVVLDVSDAGSAAITDAVVDNGYVDGSPARIAPGVADVLFKDGGAATNDPIRLEITAPRGHTAISNFQTPIWFDGTTIGLKAFREAPTKTQKNVAVTVSGICE